MALFKIHITEETRYLRFSSNQDMHNESHPAAGNELSESPCGGLLRHRLAGSQWFSTMSWEMVNFWGKMVWVYFHGQTLSSSFSAIL